MAENRKVDADFGEIAYAAGDLWEGKREIEFLGGTSMADVQLDIDEDEGVEDFQRVAFRQFAANEKDILRTCEQVLADYRDRELANLDCDGSYAELPIEESVSLRSICFPYAEEAPVFGLLLDCDWDPDNGIGIRFENGVLDAIGTQNLLL